jgi:HEAT repeat protein
LAGYGDERGRAALERLAFDVDPAVRLRAATAMGEVGNEEFATTLIALLDDDQGVRRAALASLPSVTGHTITLDKGESQQDLVAAWKRWATTR